MPTISTLVAIYNVEDYLIKCLDSIRNQTCKDIEVICVDDGSTDTSGKICEDLLQLIHEYKAEFIKKCYERVPDYQSFGEDLLCSIHCFLEAKCLLISDLTHYHYVIRKGSLTRKIFSEMVASEISLVKEIRNILEHTPEYADYKMMIDHRVKRQIAFFLKNNCDKGYMVQYYELDAVSKLLGKKVVLYGAGIVGQDYYTQLSKYPQIEIVAWIDKCPEKYKFEFFEVQRIAHIHSIEFDIVLICVNNENVAQEMIRTLSDMGIDREKNVV